MNSGCQHGIPFVPPRGARLSYNGVATRRGGGDTIATEDENDKQQEDRRQKPDTTRGHDKPLSLHPMTEDEVLRRLLDAGRLPGKGQKQPDEDK